MNYKEILQEFKEDMYKNILPLILTTLVVIIYAFSMMIMSPFILIYAGLCNIFTYLKDRFFDKKYIN